MIYSYNSRTVFNASLLIAVILCFIDSYSWAQEKKEYQVRTIAFYNLENLFDTEDDPFTFDDDRTPTGKDVWTEEKYRDKLKKMARVLSEIGREISGNSPVIIGLCELENRRVLEDLVAQPQLLDAGYEIIHYDSPDRRGIDVALLYQNASFEPLDSQSRRLLIYDADQPSKRVYTRDQLVVSGLFEGEPMYFIVNHWPSRSGGEAKSSYKRESAARLNKRIMDSIYRIDPSAKIMTMGDFNDDPSSKSIKKILNAKSEKEKTGIQELYNPMEHMLKQGLGSLAYRDGWNLFDQILLSQAFLEEKQNGYRYYKAAIFNRQYLITPRGQFRGYPFRSYDYGGYTGGYSDHFPVYLFLVKELKPPDD
jgi:hypothetical protein